MGISPIDLHSKCVAGQKNSVSMDQFLHQEPQLVCVETAKVTTTATTAAQLTPQRKSTTTVRNTYKGVKI